MTAKHVIQYIPNSAWLFLESAGLSASSVLELGSTSGGEDLSFDREMARIKDFSPSARDPSRPRKSVRKV